MVCQKDLVENSKAINICTDLFLLISVYELKTMADVATLRNDLDSDIKTYLNTCINFKNNFLALSHNYFFLDQVSACESPKLLWFFLSNKITLKVFINYKHYQTLFIIQQMISLNILKWQKKNEQPLNSLAFQFSAVLPEVVFYVRHFWVKSHFPFSTFFTNMGFDVFVGHQPRIKEEGKWCLKATPSKFFEKVKLFSTRS